MYISYIDFLEDFNDEQLTNITRMIFDFQKKGSTDILPIDGEVKMAFKVITNQFRLDNIKYQETVEKNRQNAFKRWDKEKTEDATASDRMPPSAIDAKHADNENDNGNEKEKDKDIPSPKKVSKPIKDKFAFRDLERFKENKEVIIKRIRDLGYIEVEDYFDKVIGYCETSSNAKKYIDLEKVVINWLNRDSKKREKLNFFK